MKKIITLLLLSLFLASCHNEAPGEKVVYGDPDPRTVKCVTESKKTQEKLIRADTNPNIELEFLGTETILADVSSCFLKVKISNPNNKLKPDVYSLFDVVREKTREQYSTLQELEAAIEQVRNESKVSIKTK